MESKKLYYSKYFTMLILPILIIALVGDIFKSFRLKAGGNNTDWLKFKESFLTDLVSDRNFSISLFRKAFADVFPTVPVLSINFSGLEAARSIPLDLPFIVNAVAAIQYADLIMALENQTLPYEKEIR